MRTDITDDDDVSGLVQATLAAYGRLRRRAIVAAGAIDEAIGRHHILSTSVTR